MDLLALSLAGEASADSKALIESYLAEDPEFARMVAGRTERPAPPPPALDPEVEMRTLHRAKRLLSWRSAMIACGIFFGLFPVTFSAESRGPRWFPLESPAGAAISAVLALASWGAFFWIRRALRGRP
ncbi:MAG TPA: hypothetical protein VI792_00745 [Candidatus Eisenbacteria bacterium]